MRANEFLKEELSPVSYGSQGPAVKAMQQKLSDLGYNLGPNGVDGIFGPDTEAAVRAYQHRNNLKVDGIVGKDTIDSLLGRKTPSQAEKPKNRDSKKPLKTTTSASGVALKEPEFMPKLEQVADNLGIDPDVLLKVMRFESKLNPKAQNPFTKATGLIQFMPRTAESLGTSIEELYNMTATEQLDYVEKYYKMNRVRPGATVGDLYILTFMPAAARVPANFVIGNRNGGRVFNLDAAKVYAQNKVFDQNKDGIFTKGDIVNTVNQRYA